MSNRTDNPRDVLLQLCGSLTLADHMGDASNYVDTALKRIGLSIQWDSWEELAQKLHEMGVTTLYGTALGGYDNE